MTVITVAKVNIGLEVGIEGVINAANQQLQLGEGVARAIKEACGPAELQLECDEFCRELRLDTNLRAVPTGGCAITSAYNMAPTQGKYYRERERNIN